MSVNIKQNGSLTPIAGMDDQINDSTASSTTTYSSNKINTLLGEVGGDKIRWSEAKTSVKKNYCLPVLNGKSYNNVTVTTDSKGISTVNGTAGESGGRLALIGNSFILPAGEYLLSTEISDPNITDSLLTACIMKTSDNSVIRNSIDKALSFTLAEETECFLGLNLIKNTVYSNVIIKIMIRLASIEDDTYVPYIPDNVELKALADTKATKSGDTFTGRVSFKAADNNVQINFRPESANYYSTIQHQTGGDEATIFATKTAATSYIFNNGYDAITNQGNGYYWQQMTPGLQIKENKVAINKLIPNGQSQTYNLDVGGTINASGAITQNGTQVALDLHLDQSVTLSTSDDTTVTFTNANIHADSAVEPWASVYGLVASNVVTTEGQCVVTFPKQDTAETITCRIYIK